MVHFMQLQVAIAVLQGLHMPHVLPQPMVAEICSPGVVCRLRNVVMLHNPVILLKSPTAEVQAGYDRVYYRDTIAL
jgi:hypothetical protein